MSRLLRQLLPLAALIGCSLSLTARAREPVSFEALADEYAKTTRPLLARFCLDCHSSEQMEGDLDLEQFTMLDLVRPQYSIWQKVTEMLETQEMPPKEGDQPSTEERRQLLDWISRYLDAEAKTHADDPGPVVLRRLSNAEYAYTLLDLLGVDLDPAREFPVDGAAGEGFTNAGAALVMSPALLDKYLDAAKEISRHVVLLPDGIRFDRGATRRDWTDEILAQIKAFYSQFADGEGRLPIERYLAATLEARQEIVHGKRSIEEVAAEGGLNAKYLASLWTLLNSTDSSSSPLLASLRSRWQAAKPGDASALAKEVAQWQSALFRLQSVGHMKPWVVTVSPLVNSQELSAKIQPSSTGNETTLYLAASSAGDNQGDFVVWQRPRLSIPGRPDLPLREARAFLAQMLAQREQLFRSAAKCLNAAAEVQSSLQELDTTELAMRYEVEPESLNAWLDYLGIGSHASVKLDYLTGQIPQTGGYDFVQGWGTTETPQLIANSSEMHVRVPGQMRPHGVALHPSPTLQIAAGWRSPISGTVKVDGRVIHAHPECGNGVTWTLELRRGNTRHRLAAGTSAGATAVNFGPVENLAVQPGDLVSIFIGPRDGNHACDLTTVDLRITTVGDNPREWNLAADVSPDILAGNPHADRQGNNAVWHFYTEPVSGNDSDAVIPAGSILTRWSAAQNEDEKQKIANELEALLAHGPPRDAKHPDAVLYRNLASLSGPLFIASLSRRQGGALPDTAASSDDSSTVWGLDPELFGKHPDGSSIDAESLCVQAPSQIEIRLPADLVSGCKLVATGTLHRQTGGEGMVQLDLSSERKKDLTALRSDTPVVVQADSGAQQRIEAAFEEYRRWFPTALAYRRIVPVDEAVTLTLFHREDEPLVRLMLDDAQRARLDRLWEELHFVSQDALTIVDAFAQLMEYATQDSDPRLFEPYREPINDRAAAYQQSLIDSQPRQLDAVLEFAAQAYRRPLSDADKRQLRGLYDTLRREQLPHDEALRLLMARILVSPAFLYRLEQSSPGTEPKALSDWELASRLSYFLWSSVPDAPLTEVAAAGKLHDPDTLVAQAQRMQADPRIRRFAIEFACQWLGIRDFDTLDEKSESHFPTFVSLRGDMREEAVRFMTDLVQRDGSMLDLLNADYTFLNESLAAHYGITGVTGMDWRRVGGVREQGRGGVLGLAATLAKQSGASRTSPVLRGNWIVEVLLGERMPRPPKDVPKLPEDESAGEGLSVRQLVEMHSQDARCATCHKRMDPFGFALESFDAIGRRRDHDLGNRPIDTHAVAPDGASIDGIDGLRTYLLTAGRDRFVKQFCRKLLGFALGRGIQLSDRPLLAQMQEQLESNEYRFSAAIEPLVRSPQFRQIRGKDAFAQSEP